MLKIGKLLWNNLSCNISCINIKGIKDELIYNKITLLKKPEFHMTIIGTIGFDIGKKCSVKQIKQLKKYINNFDFQFKLTDNVYFLEKDYGNHVRYSRIIKLKMKRQNEFIEQVSTIIGFDYLLFPHVTSHSFANLKEKKNIGIEVKSKKDLFKYLI